MTRARYRSPHDFGLGGVAIGNEFRLAKDGQAEATGRRIGVDAGAASSDHILADQAALRAKISDAFWGELRCERILHRDATVPRAEAEA